jgi:Flp pilus assembly protein TadG
MKHTHTSLFFLSLQEPLFQPAEHPEKEIFMKNDIQSKTKEHGQSMVELALTITILMVLLAGTIDFGRAFFTWLEMRDAAQEGASFGSICPDDTTEMEARVRDNLNPVYTYGVGIDIPNSSITEPITITVNTNLPLTTPFLGTILGSQTITIRATINDNILTSECPPP